MLVLLINSIFLLILWLEKRVLIAQVLANICLMEAHDSCWVQIDTHSGRFGSDSKALYRHKGKLVRRDVIEAILPEGYHSC